MRSCVERLLAALALAGLASAGSAQVTAPDVLVRTVTLEVVGILSTDKEIQAGGRRKVIELIEAKVLPHFNFATMTALAMGQNWNRATAEQKKKLTEEFRLLLVRTYASAIMAYRDQKFEFRPLRAKATDTDVTVHVRVLQTGAQSIAIDYGMEKTASGWKAYDVMVGGVSLVANYRTEFNNVVREKGVDGLIKDLHAKNRALDPGAAERTK